MVDFTSPHDGMRGKRALISPPFTIAEYASRRERLMAAIGPDSVAIVPSASYVQRNSDVDFPFRQESNFFYLTGFDEPDCVLILTPGNSQGETTLLLRPRDVRNEQWEGERLGPDRAPQALGVDQALENAAATTRVPRLLDGRAEIHTFLGANKQFESRLFSWIDILRSKRKQPPARFCQLSETLHELRVVKTELEIEAMQRAADISSEAHIRAMRMCRPGLFEYQLEGEIVRTFFEHGAREPAYPSIVGAGANACVMHYIQNSDQLHDGDLVLIDAGCEFQHYAADITRTFPVNGRFSSRQRDLYQVVLHAQGAAIEAGQPGAKFSDLHDTSFRCLTQGLIDLGILNASFQEAVEKELAKPFTIHGCSHFLGLDVHDVGATKKGTLSRTLCEGMVFTVEPGLYFPPGPTCDGIDDGWKGLGIRIEDDILIEADGNRVLTVACPKEPEAVEATMHGD